MDHLQRITIDPAVRFGKPCVRGTRLIVGDVLESLAAGSSAIAALQRIDGEQDPPSPPSDPVALLARKSKVHLALPSYRGHVLMGMDRS